MRVIGLLSGTSADGIDVALVRIRGQGRRLCAQLKNFCTLPFPARVQREILRVANANQQLTVSVAELSQLNFLLGEFFAHAVVRACRKFRVRLNSVDLIGSHGQTVFHQPVPSGLCGFRITSTLQLGEPSVIAERTGIPVVADFRPRDMTAGGQGAPLVPYVDYLLYRHPRRGRVALNLGGIANVTVIPAGATPHEVYAFDTGPGNMVINAAVSRLSRGREQFDRTGARAARGRADAKLLARLLRHPYFRRPPPKSTGREQFGETYLEALLKAARSAQPADVVRTATELTVQSITAAFARFILPRVRIEEVIVSGGGSRNRFLLKRLRESLPGLRLVLADQFGVPHKAKEAFAFAVLAYQSWHRQPATLPAATGARRAVVLGKIVPGR
ncbi:MAG: anhydro-N-acetylmuramic acid kinase [Terriglobia bacterium]